jgi:hypothetical protein
MGILNLFGKSCAASTCDRPKSFRPHVESLEGRQLMSAGITCTILDPSTKGRLTIGAEFRQRILVHETDGVGGLVVDAREDFPGAWQVSAVTAGKEVYIFANNGLGHLSEITYDATSKLFTTWHDMQWDVRAFDTFADSQGVHFVGVGVVDGQLWQGTVDQTGALYSWQNLGGSYQFADVLAVQDYQAVEQIFAIGKNETMWQLNESTMHWTEVDDGIKFGRFGHQNDKTILVDHLWAREDGTNGWFRKDEIPGASWQEWVHDPSYSE